MEINVLSQQGRVPVKVFQIKGDIDTASYEQLQDRAKQEIAAGTRYIVLDLSEVPYVSSYGIRAISQVFTRLKEASKDETDAEVSEGIRAGTFQSPHLKIANPTPRVRKVLTETGMDMYVQIEDDVNKAVADF